MRSTDPFETFLRKQTFLYYKTTHMNSAIVHHKKDGKQSSPRTSQFTSEIKREILSKQY